MNILDKENTGVTQFPGRHFQNGFTTNAGLQPLSVEGHQADAAVRVTRLTAFSFFPFVLWLKTLSKPERPQSKAFSASLVKIFIFIISQMLHGRPKEFIVAAFIQLKYPQILTEIIFVPLWHSLMSEQNDLNINKCSIVPPNMLVARQPALVSAIIIEILKCP